MIIYGVRAQVVAEVQPTVPTLVELLLDNIGVRHVGFDAIMTTPSIHTCAYHFKRHFIQQLVDALADDAADAERVCVHGETI